MRVRFLVGLQGFGGPLFSPRTISMGPESGRFDVCCKNSPNSSMIMSLEITLAQDLHGCFFQYCWLECAEFEGIRPWAGCKACKDDYFLSGPRAMLLILLFIHHPSFGLEQASLHRGLYFLFAYGKRTAQYPRGHSSETSLQTLSAGSSLALIGGRFAPC